MHFDARLGGVPQHLMTKCGDVEVGAQLAVDPHEQVAVEGGGDAERIVVGQQQVGAPASRDRCPTSSASPVASEARTLPQKRVRARRIEVADVGAEKQRQGAALGRPHRHRLDEPALVGRLMRYDGEIGVERESVRPARSSAAAETSTRCTVSRARVAAAADQRRQLVAAAGTELDQRGQRIDARRRSRARAARAAPAPPW